MGRLGGGQNALEVVLGRLGVVLVEAVLPTITYLQTSATAQLGQTPRALLRSLKYIAIVLGPYVGRDPSVRINFFAFASLQARF